MALYSELPIYKHGCELLALALEIQTQLPRAFKRSLGEKVHERCIGMLEDMAMANGSRGEARVEQLDKLITNLRATTAMLRVGHEMRAPHPLIPSKLYAKAVTLTEGLGSQAGGWRKQTVAALQQQAPAA